MASIVVNGDTSGSVTLSAPATAGTVTVTLPATSGTMLTTASSTGVNGSAISSGTVAEAYGGTGTNTGYYGFKNRIINGNMVIAQRGTSAVNTNVSYPVDRFRLAVSNSSKVSLQQSSTVPTGAGFVNSILATSLAATTVGASDSYEVSQQIEGYNIADLGWGTASAKTVTLSFWVRSSLTGTFGGTFENTGNTRAYPFSYTISVANTWEQKTITVAGDTSGTWLTDNSRGIIIRWSLGTGSTYLNTANAWVAGEYYSVTGETKLVATNGATWYITGTQLEVGSTATSFDYRPYGTELQLCQRYFEKSYDITTAPGTVTNQTSAIFGGYSGTTTTAYIGQASVIYAVTKRAQSTITAYDGAGTSGVCTRFQLGVSNTNGSNITISDNGTKGFNAYSSGTAGATGIAFMWTASVEL